jgi:uncharacterized integral membrane protein
VRHGRGTEGDAYVSYDGTAKKRLARYTTGGRMAVDGPNDRETQGDGRLSGGAIASLIGVGLLVIFMIQNTEDVQLDFLTWSFTWPLWLLTMASAVLGAVVWFGVGVMRRHRRRKDRRRDRRD